MDTAIRPSPGTWRWPALLLLLVLLAHATSVQGVWVFDDHFYILGNGRLRALWPPRYLAGNTRPVVFASLALNHALGGQDILVYHLTNLAIHAGAALLLYGLVRRALAARGADAGRESSGNLAVVAFAAAALWAVHPLTTMPVAYIWQRCESLMAFFYLLTAYAFLRGSRSGAWPGWYGVAVLACLLGMGSKESMVSAPLFVLLLDRAVVGGSLRAALAKRWPVHLSLACTWGFLGALVATAGSFHEHEGVGFASETAAPWAYLATMPGVYWKYLRLAVWSHPLVFDYGWPIVEDSADVLLPALPVLGFAAAAVWANVRRPAAGLPLALFFLVLAPSSSIMPMPDPLVEYRMYLPLAGLTTGLVLLVRWARARALVYACSDPAKGRRRAWRAAGIALAVVLLVLAWRSARRHIDYTGNVSLWQANVRARPTFVRGWINLGVALDECGRHEEAAAAFRRASELQPASALGPLIHYGRQLAILGCSERAIEVLRAGLRYEDLNEGLRLSAFYNLGLCLTVLGRDAEALRPLAAALAVRPRDAEVHHALGRLHLRAGRLQPAIRHLRLSVRAGRPAPDAVVALARALRAAGQSDEARAVLVKGREAHPENADIAAMLTEDE